MGAAAGGGATDTANMQGAEPDAAGDGGETWAGVAGWGRGCKFAP